MAKAVSDDFVSVEYRVCKNVLVEYVADEAALTLETGKLLVLNHSASLMLKALQAGATLAELEQILAEEYGIEAGKASADAAELLASLAQAGVVESSTCGTVDSSERLSAGVSRRELIETLLDIPKMLAGEHGESARAAQNAVDLFAGEVGKNQHRPNRTIKDSLGVEVPLPQSVRRVAPFGPYAWALLESICPENIVWAGNRGFHASAAIASKPDAMKLGYPSRRGSTSAELLKSVDADVVIEVEAALSRISLTPSICSDGAGPPVIRIIANSENLSGVYRYLGEALGSSRAMLLGDFKDAIDSAVEKCRSQLGQQRRRRVYCGYGFSGLDTLGKGSLLSQVIGRVGASNVADEWGDSRLEGVQLEDIARAKPDVVLLTRRRRDVVEVWDTWSNCPVVYVPETPYPWLLGNPLVLQTLGMLWLGNAVYPDCFSYDMPPVVAACFKALLNLDIGYDEASRLLMNKPAAAVSLEDGE